ncbi:hypothetical protein GWN49_01165 [Candidatus Bathyarchaeota archaeon]|nr:hypothetical protein [Candidatus Bathyarchaeota archaeon]
MKARRALVAAVGLIQTVIGMTAIILACTIYYNFLNIQSLLGVSVELLPVSLLILGVPGFFLIASGFFLLQDR